jgi:transposase
MREPEPVEFVPIGVLGRASDEGPAMLAASDQAPPPSGHRPDRVSMIEIDLPNGVQVRVDAFVNERALQRVFLAMKGAM